MPKINEPNSSGPQEKDQITFNEDKLLKNTMDTARIVANIPSPLGPVAKFSIKAVERSAALYKDGHKEIGLAQNITCSLVGGVAQFSVMAPIVSAVGTLSGPAAPVTCAATSIVLSKLTEPVGEAARDLCHGAFDLVKQARTAAAEHQDSSTSGEILKQQIAALRPAKIDRCYPVSSYSSTSSHDKQSHHEAAKCLETKAAISSQEVLLEKNSQVPRVVREEVRYSTLATEMLAERRMKALSTVKEGLQGQMPNVLDHFSKVASGDRLASLVAGAFTPQPAFDRTIKGFQASASAMLVLTHPESTPVCVKPNVFVSPRETCSKTTRFGSPFSDIARTINQHTGIHDSRRGHIDRLANSSTASTSACSQGTPGVNRHAIFSQKNASSYLTQGFNSSINSTTNHFDRSVGEIKYRVENRGFCKK